MAELRDSRKIFDRWCRGQSADLRAMVESIREKVVPILEDQGFTGPSPEDPKEYRFAGREIALLRQRGDHIDLFDVSFYSENRPFFRVVVFRHHADQYYGKTARPGNSTLRAVGRSRWGRHRFRFSRWSKQSAEEQASKLADEVVALMPQIMDYFDHGKIGPNIGPSHKLVASKPHDEAI